MSTELKLHKAQWNKCLRCRYGHARKCKPFLLEGETENPDVLIVGYFPGDAEELFGKMFQGQSGELLLKLIEASDISKLKLAYTYAIACRPRKLTGERIRQPSTGPLNQCAKRIKQIVRILKPSAIVVVGRAAGKAIEKVIDVDDLTIYELHSTYKIVGSGVSHRDLLTQQSIDILDEVYDDLVGEKNEE